MNQFGQAQGTAGMGQFVTGVVGGSPMVEKDRLRGVLEQTQSGLNELQKCLAEIYTRLQGAVPATAEAVNKAPIPTGSVGLAVELRSQVTRLQDLASGILNEL